MLTSLQNLCLQKGVSLLSLAKCFGVDVDRMQAIYLGRWTPSPIQRENISRSLDTSSADISWQHRNSVEHFYGPI